MMQPVMLDSRNAPNARPRRKVADLLLPVLLAVGSLVVILGIHLSPPDQGPLALVFPPWWDGQHARQAAGSVGRVIGTGAVASIVIIEPRGNMARGDAIKSGAILVLNPQAMTGCHASRQMEM
ncbi:hypothetical protein [Komagataeibacter saccharivorans]|uniref:hypothetical protein n=1 Tax=Komagataeibacter saccharivorans TaxID=265959 RepID=UPI0039EB8B18